MSNDVLSLDSVIPPPANAVEPGTGTPVKPPRVKQERAKLVFHPSLVNEAGQKVLLTVRPADFNSAKHQPLKKSDFVNEIAFLEDAALACENRAKKLRDQIAAIQAGGGSATTAAAAKSFIKARAKLAELEALLRANNIDPSSLPS
jgi:hypothetical protein